MFSNRVDSDSGFDLWVPLLVAITGALAILYLLLKHTYTYWDRNGFKSIPDVSYIFGHFGPIFLKKEIFARVMIKLYNATSEPFIGFYSVLSPILMIRDPDLVRNILNRDFPYFSIHRDHSKETHDPLRDRLSVMFGEKWKDWRAKISAHFTTAKLKETFPILIDCGIILQNHLETLVDNGESFELHEILSRHITNISASFTFGIKTNALNDPNNIYRRVGKSAFPTNFLDSIERFLTLTARHVIRPFHINDYKPFAQDFFIAKVKENIQYREQNNIVRNDFFQLLMQMRGKEAVQSERNGIHPNGGINEVISNDNEQKVIMTVNQITAQVALFFSTTTEATARPSSFLLYQLASNPHLQTCVQNEIDRVLERFDGKLSYESILEMTFLDNCIDETLRMFPTFSNVIRTCSKDYQIPGTDKVVKKGYQVMMPMYAMHMSEKYYSEPNKFKPNRFDAQNSEGKTQINRPFYPFGSGPRKCVAMRFGKLIIKVNAIMILRKFNIKLDDKLKNQPFKFDTNYLAISLLGGIYLNFTKRKCA